jgi:hypothetical protein
VAAGVVLNSFVAYPTQSLIGSGILVAATAVFFVVRRSEALRAGRGGVNL